MHVTPEFAGLIAQVFPTLVIALLLEGRWRAGTPQKAPARWMLTGSHYIRMAALMGATLSTFVCLYVVARKQEHVAVDILVTASTWALMSAFFFMISHVTDMESWAARQKAPARN